MFSITSKHVDTAVHMYQGWTSVDMTQAPLMPPVHCGISFSDSYRFSAKVVLYLFVFLVDVLCRVICLISVGTHSLFPKLVVVLLS